MVVGLGLASIAKQCYWKWRAEVEGLKRGGVSFLLFARAAGNC